MQVFARLLTFALVIALCPALAPSLSAQQSVGPDVRNAEAVLNRAATFGQIRSVFAQVREFEDQRDSFEGKLNGRRFYPNLVWRQISLFGVKPERVRSLRAKYEALGERDWTLGSVTLYFNGPKMTLLKAGVERTYGRMECKDLSNSVVDSQRCVIDMPRRDLQIRVKQTIYISRNRYNRDNANYTEVVFESLQRIEARSRSVKRTCRDPIFC